MEVKSFEKSDVIHCPPNCLCTSVPHSCVNGPLDAPQKQDIHEAIKFLEEAANSLAELVSVLSATFNPVICVREQNSVPAGNAGKDRVEITGSYLRQLLMSIAMALRESNTSIRLIIEQADL